MARKALQINHDEIVTCYNDLMMKHTQSGEVFGVVKTGIAGRPTDYLFRVSLKAVIFDAEGRLLVTNEAGRAWHLPGGGMDHGETIETGLKRELAEEIGYEGGLHYDVVGAEPMWMGETLKMWQMWIVCKVQIDSFDFMDDRSRLIELDELAQLTTFDAQLSHKYALRAR